MAQTIPLFPLHTVLFPGGPLRLRIFEPRYLDMVSRCIRESSAFGVALIVDGREVGPAKTVNIGTTARILDFERLSDGLLGISARGEHRFRIESVAIQADGLNVADVELLHETVAGIPAELKGLSKLMGEIYPQVSLLYDEVVPKLEDAGWVSSRLAELLPVEPAVRQACLERDDAVERLRYLASIISAAQSDS
jgi:Lon protease-like protein